MAILDQNGIPFPRKPETREIASISLRDKYSAYPSQGLSPERLARIFKEADQGDIYRQMELFEEMEEKDTHLFSILQTRKMAVQGLDWEVMPYSNSSQDKKIAEFVGEVLYNFENFDDMLLDQMDAVGKGLAVSEIMWTIKNGQVWIDDIKWRHQKRFTYDDYWNLRLLTDESPTLGIEIPPAKLVVNQYKAKSGHPSRAGILRVCAWMYLFKNYSIKDWVGFVEVYGKPIRLGKYKPNATKDDKEALYQALVQIGTDAAGIVSESTLIEFIETKTAAGATVHQALAQFCNSEMSKAVLGQTLTTEIGDKGSYAASQTHGEVRQDLLEADCKAIAKVICRDIIKPLVIFNFGEVQHLPWIKFKYEPPEDTERIAKTYSVLIKDIGLPVAQEHIYEKFGIPKPEEKQELVNPLQQQTNNQTSLKSNARKIKVFKKKENAPGFREGVKAVDDLADNSLQTGIDAIRKMMEPVMHIVRNSNSLEEIRERIIEAYPDIDTSKLEDILGRTMFISDLFGRWTVQGDESE